MLQDILESLPRICRDKRHILRPMDIGYCIYLCNKCVLIYLFKPQHTLMTRSTLQRQRLQKQEKR